MASVVTQNDGLVHETDPSPDEVPTVAGVDQLDPEKVVKLPALSTAIQNGFPELSGQDTDSN